VSEIGELCEEERRGVVGVVAAVRRATGWLLLPLLLLPLGGGLMSCGGERAEGGAVAADSEAIVAPGEAGSDATPAGQDEEAIVFAVRHVPDALDPLGDLDPWGTRVAEDAVFEGLTRRSAAGAPWAELGLADSCVMVPADAPREAYCHLPTGRRFHDDTEVGVEDVSYSLEYWLDPRRGGQRLRHGLGALKRIEVVDAAPAGSTPTLGEPRGRDPGRWIRVSMSEPDPLLLQRLAGMFVVPREAHRGRAKAFGQAPVGTGPRSVAVMESGRLVLSPVAADGGPAIVLREIMDGAEAVSELRRGNVHLIAEMAAAHVPDELAKPATAPRFAAWLLTPPHYDLILYNVRTGAQSSLSLRAALDDALPRAAIAGLVGGTPPLPLGAPVDLTPPTPVDLTALATAETGARLGMAGLPAALDPAADATGLQAAAEALDAQGWTVERGQRRRGTTALRLVLMWNDQGGAGRQMAHAVRDTWGQLGVRVPFATASWAYLLGPLRRGDFDIALGRLAERSDADLFPYFHSSGELNVSGVADDELDAALIDFREAATPQARQDAKVRVAARLSALRPVSVLRAPTAVLVVSRRLTGLEFEDDLPRLSGLGLSPPRDWELVRR
jgi:ABC-type transport system substrate-binding protein